VLAQRSVESRFATVIYGEISPNGHLTYCNAGHNAPLLIGQQYQRRLRKGGLILGAFQWATFEEEMVQLSPGDLLVAFSDGITEALNSAGKEFGEHRLLKCIKTHRELEPKDLLEHIFETVHQFSGDSTPYDDLTALVLRYG
jgi:phosphoserine phosphatase RsbU/P